MQTPIRPVDADAIATARALLGAARFGALGVIEAVRPQPLVTRVAMLADGADALLLLSALSQHTRALDHTPDAALMIGEPGPTGDPLTHPRLTLQGRVTEADKRAQRDRWLRQQPKSKLYYDFADFRLFRLRPDRLFLNAGFGKAYALTPADLS